MYINKKIEGVNYTKRPGAYAIITRSEDEKIAIIISSNKHFYVGGKIEENETAIEALQREALEETGYSLKDIALYKVIKSYEKSDSLGYLDVTANIFIAKFDEKVAIPIEKGYKIIWVNPEEYVGKMNYNWHNYILEKYVEDNKYKD